MVTKFEPGVTYFTRSACDHNCIWRYVVVRRSDSSVWVRDASKPDSAPQRRKVSEWSGVEQFSPMGTYSMAPVISADRVVDGVRDRADWEKGDAR